MKRYRAPTLGKGEIKLQRGRIDGGVDMCIFYNDDIPKCDRALILNRLCSDVFTYSGESRKSLCDELESRGYDLDTLKFSIEKKKGK